MSMNKHLLQNGHHNLVDMLFRDFEPTGLSKEEIFEICKKCILEANCCYSYMRIAEVMVSISEYAIAKGLYKKSQTMLNEASDYKYLADSIIDHLPEFGWGLKLLQKATALTNNNPNPWDYALIASSYSKTVGDNLKAKELFKVAEEYAVLSNQISFVADLVLESLKDSLWYAELMEKAKEAQKFVCLN